MIISIFVGWSTQHTRFSLYDYFYFFEGRACCCWEKPSSSCPRLNDRWWARTWFLGARKIHPQVFSHSWIDINWHSWHWVELPIDHNLIFCSGGLGSAVLATVAAAIWIGGHWTLKMWYKWSLQLGVPIILEFLKCELAFLAKQPAWQSCPGDLVTHSDISHTVTPSHSDMDGDNNKKGLRWGDALGVHCLHCLGDKGTKKQPTSSQDVSYSCPCNNHYPWKGGRPFD